MVRRKHGGRNDPEYDFSASVNPLGPPDAVIESLHSLTDEHRDYPNRERENLRRLLASEYDLKESNVLLGAGIGGILSILSPVCDGAHIQVGVPTFTEYEDLVGQRAGTVDPVQFPIELNDHDAVLSSFEFQTSDFIFLCNPNNPTGSAIPAAVLEKLLSRCEEHQTKLIVDEAYVDLTDTPGRWSVDYLAGQCDNLVVLKSFTKVYGMAGLRIGYVLGASAILKQLRQWQNPWPVGAPALTAAKEVLSDTDFLARTRDWLKSERTKMLSSLSDIPDITVYDSVTNFVLVHSQHKDLGSELRTRGIALRDASNFTSLGDGWYRISLQLPDENEYLIRTLKQVLQPSPSAIS